MLEENMGLLHFHGVRRTRPTIHVADDGAPTNVNIINASRFMQTYPSIFLNNANIRFGILAPVTRRSMRQQLNRDAKRKRH